MSDHRHSLTALLAASLLVACGGSQRPSATDPAESARPVTDASEEVGSYGSFVIEGDRAVLLIQGDPSAEPGPTTEPWIALDVEEGGWRFHVLGEERIPEQQVALVGAHEICVAPIERRVRLLATQDDGEHTTSFSGYAVSPCMESYHAGVLVGGQRAACRPTPDGEVECPEVGLRFIPSGQPEPEDGSNRLLATLVLATGTRDVRYELIETIVFTYLQRRDPQSE